MSTAAITPDRSGGRRATSGGAVHRAFWRWHFYAGLLVMPWLMLMALTGGLYLFQPEIEAAVRRPLLTVEASNARTDPQAWADAAVRAAPGRLVQVLTPATPTASAQLVTESADGVRRTVYVNPHDGRVLGVGGDGELLDWVVKLHSLDFGWPVLNGLIEVVAGWAIVMVATGVVLWWPREGTGGVVTVRGSPRSRVFWRDLHAVTGVVAGALIVFLAVTGMPWSAVWGSTVRDVTNDLGWGRPRPPAGAAAWSRAGHAGHGAAPWSLQTTTLPAHAGHGPVSLDAVVATADAAGLPRPYRLTAPAEPGRAWVAAHMPAQVENTRTLYLDGEDGRLLADVGYGQFGPAAKALEWGVAVHQGRQYGAVNRWLMLSACVSIWVLGVTGLVMWWRRKPSGRLAAPPPPADRAAYLPLAAVVGPLAVIYPLVGASLLIVLALDVTAGRLLRRPTSEPTA